MACRQIIINIILIFSLIGCVKYEKKPIIPAEILKEVEAIRSQNINLENNQFTFEEASELMSQFSPQLLQIRTKYDSAKSVAGIKTPWLNPTIEFGPDFGSALAPGVSSKIGPFVGLGFTLPLGGKLRKNNDLNQAKANRALLEVQAQHRDLYLALRQSFTLLYLAKIKEKAQQDLSVATQLILKNVKSLMKAGSIDVLDVGMLELDANKANMVLLDVQQEVESAQANLSQIIGLDLKALHQASMASLPSVLDAKLPEYNQMKELLLENHLDLARLRFDYEIAEKDLRLEISRQYPDIHLGGERSKEVDASKVVWGLRLGITVPIFDRNQQGIALALAKREEIRSEYMMVLNKALSFLDKNIETIRINSKKQTVLIKEILPSANANMTLADKFLKAGGIDSLKYLMVLRSYQETTRESILIEMDLRLAWLDLEKNLGMPLLPYPGEKKFNMPLDGANERMENQNEK